MTARNSSRALRQMTTRTETMMDELPAHDNNEPVMTESAGKPPEAVPEPKPTLQGNARHLIPLNRRTERERRAIQAAGGRATKGMLRPHLWTCKACQYARDKTCSVGLQL